MSAGNKTYKVLFSHEDPSSTPELKRRASGTVKIGHVKDDAHARHVFKVKYADRYKDAKVTRVTQVKASVDDSAARIVVGKLLRENQKSDQTLTNDANFVVSRLRASGGKHGSLADHIIDDHDEEGARQYLLILFSADEEDALPGFWNLFSNMERDDMETVADKVIEILYQSEQPTHPLSREEELGEE